MDSPARPSQAKMASSTGGTEGSSPASSPASAASLAAMAAPKFGTLVPNRIFVGGISANTSEAELAALFSAYGNVKATKIIADRGGVSKGYGFVTFETEEEAKRLQQESECITLRERKLNIAPAIKKQPFNRSFDGGTGSPPAVPTSTYYYTNGMGLPYQNGMTFYNAGAPTPGAAIAPPTDPTTLYQAAGVFGPQATASHQTFAPMMYPVPAPSLYMPQQYQYSPMPYEPYFPGTTAAGAPQYLYTANGAQATQSGSGNGSASSSSGTTAASAAASGVSNPASAAMGPSPATFQTHFYSPTGAATSHHPHPASISTAGPHGPPPQMEHLYYSYPPPPHATQAPPPPHHAGPLALANDQQLLVYTTDMGGPHSYISDTQMNQPEESRSTSSHSEPQQQLQPGGTATTSDSGGGGGGGGGASNSVSITQATAMPSSDPNVPTVLPLMPLKYPVSNRYHPTFHPVTLHPVSTQHTQNTSQQQQQQQINSSSNSGNNNATSDSTNDETTNNAPLHYRAVSVYHHPTPLYIPQNAAGASSPYHHPPGNSLLPTPPQQPYDLGAPKYREYSTSSGGKPGAYVKPPPPQLAQAQLIHHQMAASVKHYNGPPLHPHGLHKYARVGSPPARLSHHQHQQMGKRGGGGLSPVAGCYLPPKGQYPNSRQQFIYPSQSPYAMPQPTTNLHRGFNLSYEYVNSGRRSSEPDAGRRRNAALVNTYRGSNLTMSPAASNALDSNACNNSSKAHCEKYNSEAAKTGNTVAENSNVTNATTSTSTATVTTTVSSGSNTTTTGEIEGKTATTSSSNSNSPPPQPPTSSSPMTSRPHPNLSPSPNPNQVPQQQQQQFGQRYNSGIPIQQQRGGRYQTSISSQRGKGGMRQASTKFKLNGIVQSSPGSAGNIKLNEIGAAGDAPMLPITPPSTPQQQQSDQQQANDACHQMQALSL